MTLLNVLYFIINTEKKLSTGFDILEVISDFNKDGFCEVVVKAAKLDWRTNEWYNKDSGIGYSIKNVAMLGRINMGLVGGKKESFIWQWFRMLIGIEEKGWWHEIQMKSWKSEVPELGSFKSRLQNEFSEHEGHHFLWEGMKGGKIAGREGHLDSLFLFKVEDKAICREFSREIQEA